MKKEDMKKISYKDALSLLNLGYFVLCQKTRDATVFVDSVQVLEHLKRLYDSGVQNLDLWEFPVTAYENFSIPENALEVNFDEAFEFLSSNDTKIVCKVFGEKDEKIFSSPKELLAFRRSFHSRREPFVLYWCD